MDSQWLKVQFELHPEKTKAALAKALGLEASAVSKILSGARQIKASEYMVMRRFFGLPVDGDRAAGGLAGRRDREAASYVLSPLSGSGMHEADQKVSDNAGQDAWVMPASLFENRTKAAPDKIRIFTVQEGAMAPDFLPGEHVLVDLSARQPSPPGVFVVSDGMGHIIRQCAHVPHSDPPQIRLLPLNDQYEPYTVELAQAEIIGRVIAKLQWL